MLAKSETTTSYTMKMLPEHFQPGEHDVIFGRGRNVFYHSGNEKFRRMVADSLREYSETTTKLEKSYILRNIVSQVRMNSPEGGFVKKDHRTGRWYEVGDFLAREKTSQTFRDALYEQYKSSNTAKKLRRLQDQDFPLPRRSHSAMTLIGAKGKPSFNSVTAFSPNASFVLNDANGAAALIQSCPDLGYNHADRDMNSMRNFEWDAAPAKKALAAGGNMAESLLAMTGSRQGSARSVLDFSYHSQLQKAGLAGQMNENSLSELNASQTSINSYHSDTLPQQFMVLSQSAQAPLAASLGSSLEAARLLQLQNQAAGMLGVANRLQAPMSAEVFERLLSLVGDLKQEGDPFEPKPVESLQSAPGSRQVYDV